MLSGVVHDLNNIFAVIGGHAELLDTNLVKNGEAQEWIDCIRGSVRHASQLTNRLLSFSRPHEEVPTLLNLSDIVRDLKPIIRALVGSSVELILPSEDGCSYVMAHRDRIEQIILNLIGNSRDALPHGGVIGIRTATIHVSPGRAHWPADRPCGPYSVITVADNGTGIDRRTLSRIFEPFFTTKGSHGTGLGLATVREIVDGYRGHIEVDSDPDLGTIFRIFLPAELDSIRIDPEHGINYEGFTALLVDDDDQARSMAMAVLESIGLNVIQARNGEEASRLASVVQEPIDLLVTDAVMPGIGGRKLAERLRFSRPGMPVVYISGYPPAETLDSGMCFVSKPFHRTRLIHAVQQVMNQVVVA